MEMLKLKLEEAVKLNLSSRGFVKGLDLRESAISFSDKDNKLFIAINYAKWLFSELDKLKLIEVNLDGKTVGVFEIGEQILATKVKGWLRMIINFKLLIGNFTEMFEGSGEENGCPLFSIAINVINRD